MPALLLYLIEIKTNNIVNTYKRIWQFFVEYTPIRKIEIRAFIGYSLSIRAFFVNINPLENRLNSTRFFYDCFNQYFNIKISLCTFKRSVIQIEITSTKTNNVHKDIDIKEIIE